jgi:hypothetical protein
MMAMPLGRDRKLYSRLAQVGGYIGIPQITAARLRGLNPICPIPNRSSGMLTGVGAGCCHLARPSGVQIPSGADGRQKASASARGERHPFPSPRPAYSAGATPKFSPLFLGGVF